jgi:acetyltransferase
MSLYRLDNIFKPKSVAVVGASDRPMTVGRALVKNLIDGHFGGTIYPVNPKKKEILGLDAYPSLSDIGQPVDMAVISTPIATVPDIMEECARLGIGGAIIISAGGKEVGPEGEAIEARIREIAHAGKVRVVGPNCLGVISLESKLNASFGPTMPLPGNLAFISQSGAVCTAVLDYALKEKVGFSYFISIGSMLDVDYGDLIDYLGNDPNVSSILLYVEMVNNHRKFMSAARAVSRVKPIVVLKSGRSAAGAKAAQSHTGSLAGEDAVYDAAFKRAGIVRVDTLGDMFGCSELMSKVNLPQGPNLAIITNAGGPGVMTADYLAGFGIDPAPLSKETLDKISAVSPYFWSKNNPIDLTGAATPETFKQVIQICREANEFDAALFMTPPQAMFSAEDFARMLASELRLDDFPFFAVWLGGEEMEVGKRIMNEAGVPTYLTPEEAIRAFHYMYMYGRNLKALQEVPRELTDEIVVDRTGADEIVQGVLTDGRALLTEDESKRVMVAYGIPVNETHVAGTAEEAVRLARKMGYPVAAKVHSLTLTHKSDAGGVRLDLRNADEVIDAFEAIEASVKAYDPDAHFGGVTIQKMVGEKGHEVIIGSKMDPDFGPVILFGEGGIMTEVYKDRTIGLPPLNRALARRMIEETKVYKILRGYRNIPPANLDLLEEILIRLSMLVTDFPEIMELDINPLLLTPENAWALDARIVVNKAAKPAPLHLAISPYPAEYEITAQTKNGRELFIRPIRPEDAPLLSELFDNMSEQSRFNRFLRHVPTLTSDILVRFTQIDYDRDLALVALDLSGEKPVMVGVTRLEGDPDGIEAEMAVVVGDPWHGQGVGALLMKLGIRAAQKRGLKKVWGIVLPQNTGMLTLAEHGGGKIEPIEDGKKMKVSFDVGSMAQ